MTSRLLCPAFLCIWCACVSVAADTKPTAPPAPSTPAPKSATQGQAANTPYRAVDGRWWWHDGRQWWYLAVQPVEGQVYGSFRMQGGKMVRNVVEAVPVQRGYWATQCHGGVCRRVWVPQ